MSRLEEALKRAQRDPNLPEAFSAPDPGALSHFPLLPDGQAASAPGELAAEPRLPERPALAARPSSASFEAPSEQPFETVFRSGKSFDGKLVTNDVKVVAVEQYRKLAATLHHKQAEDGTKVVMIASALAGEGKTLTAVNLALTLSESYGRRVLLVDADFRRPTLHEAFHVPNTSGLNEALAAPTERKLTLAEISPRLALLPAGRPNPDPMSGLTSDRMRRIIEDASATFDWVIIRYPARRPPDRCPSARVDGERRRAGHPRGQHAVQRDSAGGRAGRPEARDRRRAELRRGAGDVGQRPVRLLLRGRLRPP